MTGSKTRQEGPPRHTALGIVESISKGAFKDYEHTRDSLECETTHLSVYLKFGCVSNEKNASLNTNYDKIPWAPHDTFFMAWCSGRTGFPIVDAGIRQLLTTGYMHNRVRMISASFLIKVLRVDWRLGEKFFAQRLVDYHPSANSGGWQWASGGGADSQQYNRVFSPWLQAKKHDPNCVYIKTFIPELNKVPNADILTWNTAFPSHEHATGYPRPIVADYHAEAKQSFAIYKKALYAKK
ncbi:Deoxyribodipyrimidine photo-lyase [Tetrabaena socialis]|uniref:Deoxyribodipyrimidine photo-lyase n=1 Tax=Tetrabaena socialis TaxID=47790 RepID=A0A2J8A3B2_9CHLO|nr:Deoxyribodipyrimidine photo-lyase [Tetrabaena socialis]|eukprot:PNH07009.1 Deoxyribodipyrimidine photo-lyase [Tetrabaena socialis]